MSAFLTIANRRPPGSSIGCWGGTPTCRGPPPRSWRAWARFERIAQFASAAGRPTHVARKLPDGRWTSKLGRMEDVAHSLPDLAGTLYGSVVCILMQALIGET